MNEQYVKDYFKFNCAPKATPEAMVVGDKYRFTILTSRIIRLEYAEDGKFEDRPSQTVWFRKLEVPRFNVSKTETNVKIETDDLWLNYKLNKPFSGSSLQIQLKSTKKTWKFGQKEKQNLEGTARTLDGTNGFSKMERGLLSKQGFSILNDSKTLVFNESFWLTPREDPKKIDMYFLGFGRKYKDCLKEYYKITGKTPLIPRFILGNWWSRYWEYTETELKELISNFESHKIPLSVCIIDMDWHWVKIDKKYGSGWTGYTWNTDLFPDPPEMLKWLHERNLKVSMNLHPADGIKAHEKCYKDVATFMGVNAAAEEPVPFDIADPKFVSAYFDLVHHPLEKEGVDFWWLDWQQGHSTKMKNLDPLWMLNHLHFFDLGRDQTTRSFIFSRWGGKGNHRYPIGFSGDTRVSWRSLAYQPYFTATASNVGYGWWSHDIGGHMAGTEDAELYLRWIQFAVFSPILRLHSTKNPFHKREPWRYDLTTLQYAGDALRLRHQFIPYIYTMGYLNYSEDITLMRPMYYESPEDERAYSFNNQYWYGSELIAAPIIKPRDKITRWTMHSVFLPAESPFYFNLFTHEYFEGNQISIRPYKLADIPVFAKAGAIIPLDYNTGQNTTANPEHLQIEIFPGQSNTFTLYEDDGSSELYRKNQHYQTKMQWIWADNCKFIYEQPVDRPSYIPANRKITLKFNALEMITNPTIQSDTSISITSRYDTKAHCLIVEIPTNAFKRIEISFTQPPIVKKNSLKEITFGILEDSNIGTMRKKQIYTQLKPNQPTSEPELLALVKSIRRTNFLNLI